MSQRVADVSHVPQLTDLFVIITDLVSYRFLYTVLRSRPANTSGGKGSPIETEQVGPLQKNEDCL